MQNYEEKTIKKETLYDGRIFTIEHHTVSLPNGKESTRDIVLHNGAVCVLAVKDEKILFVRQYRKAVESHVLEIPAGKLDTKTEDPLEACKRELEEETNFRANNWSKVMTFYPSPGYCQEALHLYQAEELEEVLEGALPADEDEFLDIVWIELEEALQMIHNGEIIDGKTIIAIQQYKMQLLESKLARIEENLTKVAKELA
ncbi:ADP-ribose pyrophosphatase [Granulicatella balaenopterae]|uniref:ADP-ribose pyrophosphatase n=1 Tax=Granulicatella balaenopterae TaxID=137733 RepID=A0A1H9MES0_9LACT|nr:NUDIX hydrolase [Granulicatella balaenopterae]SER21989.1 ADP-ribose pyrophosphatase [Granulicatella balaenopterae]